MSSNSYPDPDRYSEATGFNEHSVTTNYHRGKYDPKENLQFEVEGRNGEFAPRYYPENVVVEKERELVREKGICLGEYVNDIGSKNREVHISGKVITYDGELDDFHEILDLGNKYHLICMQWEGEVLLADSRLEGPFGVDVETKHWMYEYELDFVSTGKDEEQMNNSGIMEEAQRDVR